MKKLAIIGASYLQLPLINKAKEKGLETHVFAWAAGDVGEEAADYFYPISIVEKKQILKKCQEIGIDGICTIASDLAAVTVGYVADKMGLIGNSLRTVEVSTNKHLMRRCFEENGDPSPKSIRVEKASDLQDVDITYPVIVKPLDRSGSRGITRLDNDFNLKDAIDNAIDQGFDKAALVEEFATGDEYSVEFISWEGKHTFLALTKKYTTGAPGFIERGHMIPAIIDDKSLSEIIGVVEHALNSLGIMYGASHSEVKVSANGEIKIIEIGGRMGGDLIGSSLVEMATGFDFVGAVIDVSLGVSPSVELIKRNPAAVRFIFDKSDLDKLNELKSNNPELLVAEDIHKITDEKVTDSGSRFGYFLMQGEQELIMQYLP